MADAESAARKRTGSTGDRDLEARWMAQACVGTVICAWRGGSSGRCPPNRGYVGDRPRWDKSVDRNWTTGARKPAIKLLRATQWAVTVGSC